MAKFIDSVSLHQGNSQPDEGEDETIQSKSPADVDTAGAKSDTSSSVSTKSSKLVRIPLDANETAQVVKVFGYMISEYRRN